MTIRRRNSLALLGGLPWIKACGGGSAGADSAAPAPSPPAPSPPPPPAPPPPAPPPPVLGALGFSLGVRSAAASSSQVFAVGQTFARGVLPAGSEPALDGVLCQASVLNRWPDGSAKFALLAAQADLPAGTWRELPLMRRAAAAAAPLNGPQRLQQLNLRVTVGFGALGEANWSAASWASPQRVLAQGPLMNALRYRQAIGNDTHLVAWLELRIWESGALELMAWLENGYLRVASPSARGPETARLLINGVERFAQPLTLLNHQRAILASGSRLTHWLEAEPHLDLRPDPRAMMASRLVPHYPTSTPSNSALFGRLVQSYTPLARGAFPAAMGDTGYTPSIGLLPEWDAAWFSTAGDPRAANAVLIQAALAGRYGLHFRDETTQSPLRFADHPRLVLGGGAGVMSTGAASTGSYTPGASGGTPPSYSSSHHPSMGYLAYLLSGWHYFAEEMQFCATLNYLKQGDLTRQADQGILPTEIGANTTRGAAWALRTLAQACAVTPDDDPLRPGLLASLDANARHYHERYISRPHNPLGLVQPYSDYEPGPPWQSAIWMDDFFTAAGGMLLDLELLPAQTQQRWRDFMAWKYRSVVGRLAGSLDDRGIAFTQAAQYTTHYAPSERADWAQGTGPWYADWAAVAQAMGLPQTANAGSALVSGYPLLATGYWSNLLPALAYAVDHGADGAAAAWQRVQGASNFATQRAAYNHEPVWGVFPR